MSLSIGDSLREGFNRATNRNAGILFVLFCLLTLLSTVARNSATAVMYSRLIEFIEETEGSLPPIYEGITASSPPLSISMSLGVVLVFAVVMWIAGEAVRVISDRTFLSEETEQLHEPTRWIGWATLSSFGFAIIFNCLLVFYAFSIGIVSALNPVLTVFWALIGGVVLLVLSILFFFTRQEIAIRDVGPIEAMIGSWSLVRNNEIEVFGLGVVLALIDVGSQVLIFMLGIAGQFLATIVTIITTAALLVFFSAVVAQAYHQLRAEQEEDDAETTEQPLDPDNEWNDPPLS